MIRNLNAANKMPFVYDLTPNEDKFYRGSGKATMAVDVANNIIACLQDIKKADKFPAFFACTT